MRFAVGKIDVLVWIDFVVVQHASTQLFRAFVFPVFAEPVLISSNRVAVAIPTNRLHFTGQIRILQQRDKTRALEMRGFGDAGQFANGRVNVDELGECRDAGPRDRGWLLTRYGDDQWCMHGCFETGMFVPHSVVTELPAMITAQDYHGVPVQTCFVQCPHQSANLRIDETDACVVTMNQLASLQF